MTLEGVRIGVGSSIFGTGAEFVRRLSVIANVDAEPCADEVDDPGFPINGADASLGRTVALALSVI